MKTKIINFLAIVILLNGCNSKDAINEKNLSNSDLNAKLNSKFKVDNLLNLKVYGCYDLKLTKKNIDEIIVESKIGMGDSILIEKENNAYTIKINPKYKLIKQSNVNIYIPNKKLQSIEFYGAGSIKSDSKLVQKKFKMLLNGNFSVDLLFDLEKLNFERNGDGDNKLAGKINNNFITANGAGTFDLQKVQSKSSKVSNNGAVLIKIKAADKMVVENNGVGSVFIYGKVIQKEFNNVGIGRIVEDK